MVKINKIVHVEANNKIVADLYADSKDDIIDGIEPIIGLPAGKSLSEGSTAFTADMEFGILNSSGVWNFK